MALSSYDGDATEYEMQDLLYGLIRVYRSQLIVETGCYIGLTTERMAQACLVNGIGTVISCDTNENHVLRTRARCEGLPVEVRHTESVNVPELRDADMIFSDSGLESRFQEYDLAKLGCLFVIHDTLTTPAVREFAQQKKAFLIERGRGLGILIK